MNNIHSVILAAGLSTRMGSNHTNKVCLDLSGKPVICHAIEAIRRNSIHSHTVVLGACAGEVINAVNSQYSSVSYAFQSQQRGAADALRAAVQSLPEAMDQSTLLLVTPGHRIVAPQVIKKIVDLYKKSGEKLICATLQDPHYPPQNLSICLGKLDDIKDGLQQLPHTPSGELQLMDLACCMNSDCARATLTVDNFADVAGFNNPAEFLAVAELLRHKQRMQDSAVSPQEYHLLKQWLDELHDSGKISSLLPQLYGNDPDLISDRRQALQILLEKAAAEWGLDASVSVIRSPGRVNIMGRHVDHQGGNCNLMTIGYETFMAVRLRTDDVVTLQNVDDYFAPAEFSIGDLVRDLPWDDWQTLVSSPKLAKLLKQYGVNWSDYIKAVFLRFQKHFNDRQLRGMDIIVSGNVPMAAGLSSSSSLVVGAAEAVVGANRLDLASDKLVTLCGEGEWFVGTRGGAADHAAVKLGACNKVVKVGFFDFKVEKLVDFPAGYTLIVADSKIQARKSGNAKDQFNHRVSCYRIGLLLLKKLYPQYADRLQHLRDFNCTNLGIPLDWLYTLLQGLPLAATRRDLEKMLPTEDLNIFWNNHAPDTNQGIYPIRGVVLYGLAECERSLRFADILSQGDMLQAGLMMNISHNGDRVMQYDRCGNELGSCDFTPTDDMLQDLITKLRSSDRQLQASAELWRQPGSYRCSLPEIDLMTDLACGVPGVMGAQLAGAGLGGCMMVLTAQTAVNDLVKVLNEKFYAPRNTAPRLLHCHPIAGAGPIRFE